MTVPELQEIVPRPADEVQGAAERDGGVVRPLPLEAAPAARDALAALGRTEDVRLAPDGRRLAIACYDQDRVAVFDVRVAEGPRVELTGVGFVTSAVIRQPHGVDFVDHVTLVVANREGGLVVVPLPPPGAPADAWDVAPVAALVGVEPLDAPGSVVVCEGADGRPELLACVNWGHLVVRHRLDDGGLTAAEVVARRWLDVPDGIAVSEDGRWVAVSNHFTHTVLVYEHAALGEDAEPTAVLRGTTYPHGLRFSARGDRLVVADAGTPDVQVYAAPADGWRGVAYPAARFAVMDDATFARGHRTPQEGGPKGLELDPRTNVLFLTSEETPLLCFDAGAVVDDPWAIGADADALLRYELHTVTGPDGTTPLARLARDLAGADERAAGLTARLDAMRSSRTWRLTEAPRRAYAALRARTGSR